MAVFGHWYVLVFALVFFGALIVLAVWLVLRAIRIPPRGIRPDKR